MIISDTLYDKTYSILTERVDDFRRLSTVPNNPTVVFYLTDESIKFHKDMYYDLKALWKGRVDEVGFFSIDLNGHKFQLSNDGEEKTEVDDVSFKRRIDECIERFRDGFERPHTYFLIDSDNLSVEDFETAFKNGKAVDESLSSFNPLSMLIVLLKESIDTYDSAKEIRKKLSELKDQAFNGTSVISNKCSDNSRISIDPNNRARYEDFNLLADLVLLSNSAGQEINGSAFYDSDRIKAYSYSNIKRPDNQITCAILLGIIDSVYFEMQNRHKKSNFDSQSVLDKLKDELTKAVYNELKDLPKAGDLVYLPQKQEPSRKSKYSWNSEYHAAGALSGDCLDLFFERNYVKCIDNFFKSKEGIDFVIKKTEEILRRQNIIDLGYHLNLQSVDSWSGVEPAETEQLDLAFREKTEGRIIEQFKEPVKNTIIKLLEEAKHYYSLLKELVQDCYNKYTVTDENLKGFYTAKSIAALRGKTDFYSRFFAVPSSDEDLNQSFLNNIIDIIRTVRENDRELFSLPVVDELVRRSTDETEQKINQKISEQLTADYIGKRTLCLNQALVPQNTPPSYMVYIVNTESNLKKSLAGANQNCPVGFLNSGSSTSIEFIAVFSCDFDALNLV